MRSRFSATAATSGSSNGHRERRVGFGQGDGPRAGAAADVQHPARRWQPGDAGERLAGAGGSGLDPGRHDRHELVVDLEDLLGRSAASECSGKIGPSGVAQLVPELQQGSEVSRSGPGQECCGHRCIRVTITVSLQEPECDHGIGADPRRTRRETRPGRQAGQVGGPLTEGLEQAQLTGREQVFAGHEPLDELEDLVRGHGVLSWPRRGSGCCRHGPSLRSPRPGRPSQNAGQPSLGGPRILGVSPGRAPPVVSERGPSPCAASA